jgi:hypothetical protein
MVNGERVLRTAPLDGRGWSGIALFPVHRRRIEGDFRRRLLHKGKQALGYRAISFAIVRAAKDPDRS